MKNRKIINYNIEDWNPLEKSNDLTYYIESLSDNSEGLKIVLKGEKKDDKEITMIFEDYYGYRNFDESFRLKTLNNCESLCQPRVFFKVKKSNFLNWFNTESFELQNTESLTHYILATPNDIIEVISDEMPIIE